MQSPVTISQVEKLPITVAIDTKLIGMGMLLKSLTSSSKPTRVIAKHVTLDLPFMWVFTVSGVESEVRVILHE